jgi:hypothetical protein
MSASVSQALLTRGRVRAGTAVSRAGSRLAALDASPAYHRMLLRGLPQVLSIRFQPERAGELDAVIELRVRDPGGGPAAAFALTIANGSCAITRGAARNAGASAELGGDDAIRLVAGAVGWPDLLASKRLELSGDPFLALRFPQLFKLPA